MDTDKLFQIPALVASPGNPSWIISISVNPNAARKQQSDDIFDSTVHHPPDSSA